MVAETAPEATMNTSITALTEEQPPEDDPVMRAALFETATPLPDIDTLRPLPPFRRDASGPLVVQFQLNEAGKSQYWNALRPQNQRPPRTTRLPRRAKAPRVNNNPAVTACCAKCDASVPASI